MKIKSLIYLLLSVLLFAACKQAEPKNAEENFEDRIFLDAPDWSVNANIYEVNIRQYTPEGTFNAFAEHLPRLDSLGVDILWIMPVQPISQKNRKGTLGSYYAVQDFNEINPEFGTNVDFKNLVDQAHSYGMKVLIDWVPNHTGFDHIWTTEHPEWFTQNEQGEIIHPQGTDWTDVADLNYDNTEMRAAMTDAMLFWIDEYDIDGFRCDHAHGVPNDFWADNNEKLFATKHLFMLAEADMPSLHDVGFHMTYDWEFHHLMNAYYKSEATIEDLTGNLVEDGKAYPEDAYRMVFISNHDENSWKGTIEERLGASADAMAVLTFTINGMPLIYSGQEAGLSKRLEFFEKDEIDWSDFEKSALYQTLLTLKHENRSLWNGKHGGKFDIIQTDNDGKILCYSREKDDFQVIVALNLSGEPQSFKTNSTLADKDFSDVFENVSVNPGDWHTNAVELEPWSYQVLSYLPE
jgi:glycosidase